MPREVPVWAKGRDSERGLQTTYLPSSTANSIQIWIKNLQGIIKCQKVEMEKRVCN